MGRLRSGLVGRLRSALLGRGRPREQPTDHSRERREAANRLEAARERLKQAIPPPEDPVR